MMMMMIMMMTMREKNPSCTYLLALGQVWSECLTCTFRASCCSARLSRVRVPAFVGSSVWDRKLLVSLYIRERDVAQR